MSRRAAKVRSCAPSEADRRLRQAATFAEIAELAGDSADGASRSVAVSNAVLAGIAAVDTICCKRLGRRSSSANHADALVLVAEVASIGADVEKSLQTLLGLKNKAQYESTDPTVAETKQALRAMNRLIALAQRV